MDTSAAASQQNQSHSRAASDSNRAELSDAQSVRSTVFKGPKRKRLAKACDPCHKSKRRCDGTAPCSNCYFASKECTYTDSTGRRVPAPNALRPDIITSQSNANVHSPTSISISVSGADSGSYPPPESLHSQSIIQQPEASRSFTTAVRGPPLVVEKRPYETDTRRLVNDTAQILSGHRLDGPRAHSPPHKRLKNVSEIFERQGESSPQSLDTPGAGGSGNIAFITTEGNAYKRADGTVTSGTFHKHVVRELVNLFFTHCHPHRLIIHSASFHADLCRGRVPSYLLNAICAVSAPLSQNPLVRVSPIRESGRKFVETALAELFDSEGQLRETGVDVAQTLVLIQTYNVYKESRMQGQLQLYDRALHIIHSLRILETGNQASDATSFSADELYTRAIQRESARRTFWLIHLVELLGAVFTRRPTTYSLDDLAGVRLPCDEASFDLALELPLDRAEYLDTPALRTNDTSEFGHVIRIATILHSIERNNIDSPDPRTISTCEQHLEQWVSSLADHIKYCSENLQAQLSLWETGSNTSTWCFCFMHILHACAVLALSSVRRRLGQSRARDHESALAALSVIIKALGPRARNSILMGSVLWVHYCGPHAANHNASGAERTDSLIDSSVSAESGEGELATSVPVPDLLPQLDVWVKEWEELWGPGTFHYSNTIAADPEVQRRVYQRAHYTAASVSSPSVPVAEAQAPSSVALPWSVPDVVIDPVLHSSKKQESTSAPQASPALSATSTLRGRDQPSLPSLKSSGLLDVFSDDPVGSRSSGASTPIKPHASWPLSSLSSPVPPLLSPGLPVTGGLGLSGNAPVSPQSISPSFQSSHTPQGRLQVPMLLQPNSREPSPGIIAPSSAKQETGTHAALATFGPHRVT